MRITIEKVTPICYQWTVFTDYGDEIQGSSSSLGDALHDVIREKNIADYQNNDFSLHNYSLGEK